MFAAYLNGLSRYIISAILLIFVIMSICTFFSKGRFHKIVLVSQIVCIYIMQIFMFVSLYYNNSASSIFTYFLIVLLLLTFILFGSNYILRNISYPLLNNMTMLLSIGLTLAYRFSPQNSNIILIVLGVSTLLGFIVSGRLGLHKLLNEFNLFYGSLCMIILGLVFVFADMTGYFTFRGISFYPSEIILFVSIYMVSGFMSRKTTTSSELMVSFMCGSIMIFLALDKDYGTALILFIIFTFLMLISYKQPLYVILGFLVVCISGYFWVKVSSTLYSRVLTWKDPWAYADGAGYQITQSLLGIISGGWFGMGLGGGDPTSVPLVERDFIFSAICEELGIAFGLLLLVLCLCVFIQMCLISLKANDYFYKLISFGISLMFILEVIITVGSSINFIPTIGVPFPLLSLHGGSLLTFIIAFYTLQGIYRNIIMGEVGESSEE